MTAYYRFRSTDALLGDRKELEKQTIYFASPRQLNDPMEGLRDIVWKGDEIVWKNLIRHYLVCLKKICFLSMLYDEDKVFEAGDIPVFSSVESFPTDEMRSLFRGIENDVFSDPDVNTYIDRLSKTQRPIRKEEITFHLQNLHSRILESVFRSFIKSKLMPDSDLSLFEKNNRLSWFLSSGAFNHLDSVNEEEKIGVLFDAARMENSRHMWELSLNSKAQGNKKQFIYLQFSEAYVSQLENIMYPDWYAACFMTSCSNSAVWGHYSDSHTGVCLIYESESNGATDIIRLNGITGAGNNGPIWGKVSMPLHKIEYIEGLKEVDFFRSIGQLPHPTLEREWYSDGKGNLSSVGSHLHNNNIDEWHKVYWRSFYEDITKKTNDWSYENEHRLILHSSINDLSNPKNRTYTYNLTSLKGIIFGINTRNEDKREIIRIIEEKCKSEGISEFTFHQAYYSPKNRRIDHYKLYSLENKSDK